MIHTVKMLLSSAAIAVMGIFVVAAPVAAQAKPPAQLACEGSGGKWEKKSADSGKCTQGGRTVGGTIKSVGNILIFIISAVSVLMIVIGGLRYTLSGGDQGTLTAAKNTILYAVVGLVIAVASYAIVNFVLANI